MEFSSARLYGVLSVLVLIVGAGARGSDAGDQQGGMEVVPTLGFRVAVPTGVSASLSLSLARVPESPQFCTHEVLGPSLQLEAGSGGGQVGLGIALLCRDSSWIPKVGGLALRGVYVRTWGQPWQTERDQSYLGAYLDGYLARVSARIGVLWRVGATATEAKDTVVAFGVGFGF
jgi:hypothetical protein